MSRPAIPVTVESGSRLGDLLAMYAQLKPQADELATRLKGVTDAIKAELTTAVPGAVTIDVDHEALRLRLNCVERWTLDAKQLKAEDPETYVRYARKDSRWELRGRRG